MQKIRSYAQVLDYAFPSFPRIVFHIMLSRLLQLFMNNRTVIGLSECCCRFAESEAMLTLAGCWFGSICQLYDARSLHFFSEPAKSLSVSLSLSLSLQHIMCLPVFSSALQCNISMKQRNSYILTSGKNKPRE